MESRALEKRGVTPEKAVEILKKHGTNISIEQAEKVLDFMYKMAKLAVKQPVNNS